MTAIAAVLVLEACAAATAGRAVRGAHLEVLAVWTGTEQHRFQRVVDDFERRTGVVLSYSAAPDGVPDALDQRLALGVAPDVAFLPQPGVLEGLVARHRLVALDPATVKVVDANYTAVWRDLATVDGLPYGVWFKAANKSLVWYNIGAFERSGVVPPDDVDGLLDVAGRLDASGVPAFSVGGASPWTLTDWFENLYLRLAGPARYDLLAAHRLAWTDPSVVDALRLLARLLAPDNLAGGVGGTLASTFAASVEKVYDVPPGAAMTAEGDFVAGAISGTTGAVLGIDADAFPFPSVGSSGPAVVGAGDVAVLLRPSPAGYAFLRYLATPEAAALWAAAGGFISPNVNLDLSVYPDDLTRSMARSLLEAGDSFRFDLSDLQPAAFGSTPSAGMQALLQQLLVTRDAPSVAAELEAAAKAAWGR